MKRTSRVSNGIRVRKYTVTSRDVVCDDGVQRDNVSLNTELARPIGIVSSKTVSASSRKPRTSGPSSVCVTYKTFTVDEHGNRTILDGRVFKHTRERKPNRVTVALPHRITAADLAPLFAD